MNKQIKSFTVVFLVFTFFGIFFSGCATKKLPRPTPSCVVTSSDYLPSDFLWQTVAPGIERFDYQNPSIPVIYHAVKIDLNTSALELVCFPDAKTKTDSTGHFFSTKASRFAKKNRCVVAINASPFEGLLSIKKKIVGIHLFNKTEFSAPENRYAAIAFTENQTKTGLTYTAHIIKNQPQDMAQNYDFAFGGFFVVLQDGQVQESFAQIYDSRTGVGISEDGKTLYILVVEGERFSKSIGLTYPECGQIFKAMGCTDALEMDGGGSTELCINGRSILTYQTLRVQANCFGFRFTKSDMNY